MSRGILPMAITVVLSLGVYYLWSVVMNRSENVGVVLGLITSILVSLFFARIKKRR